MSTVEANADDLQRYTPHDDQHSRVVLYHLRKRADDWELHFADRVTTFAGSMTFVWMHVAIFAFWVASGLFGADRYPFQFLTFVVSLEAIFLSTFVMIGQNRQAALEQAKADHDFHEAETELKLNTELTRAIHAMTQEIHAPVAEVRQNSGRGWGDPTGRLRWLCRACLAKPSVRAPTEYRFTGLGTRFPAK